MRVNFRHVEEILINCTAYSCIIIIG